MISKLLFKTKSIGTGFITSNGSYFIFKCSTINWKRSIRIFIICEVLVNYEVLFKRSVDDTAKRSLVPFEEVEKLPNHF